MRRILLASGVTLVLAMLHATVADAMVMWCFDDPQYSVQLPNGQRQVVYVTTFGSGLEHQPQVDAQQVGYRVTGNDRKNASVDFGIYVPNDSSGAPFDVYTVVSSGPLASGTIYGTQKAMSGKTYELTYSVKL